MRMTQGAVDYRSTVDQRAGLQQQQTGGAVRDADGARRADGPGAPMGPGGPMPMGPGGPMGPGAPGMPAALPGTDPGRRPYPARIRTSTPLPPTQSWQGPPPAAPPAACRRPRLPSNRRPPPPPSTLPGLTARTRPMTHAVPAAASAAAGRTGDRDRTAAAQGRPHGRRLRLPHPPRAHPPRARPRLGVDEDPLGALHDVDARHHVRCSSSASAARRDGGSAAGLHGDAAARAWASSA